MEYTTTQLGPIIAETRIEGMTYFLRTPGYKASGVTDEYGFDVEKGSPKPNGAVAMRFSTNGSGSYSNRLSMEAVTMFK